jgi:hypothetical protein
MQYMTAISRTSLAGTLDAKPEHSARYLMKTFSAPTPPFKKLTICAIVNGIYYRSRQQPRWKRAYPVYRLCIIHH